ncbi:MoxR family ATPase [Thiospirochaeta perfilievii]|uniref:MoxR family ATPase n=2 Tax=Thiospirochaeta perfilievii TaxID=252967 RepID=A0A5C1QHE4_9SPIO|nr:MoxR family ATPase [Thiospirochaeta perfilievii]
MIRTVDINEINSMVKDTSEWITRFRKEMGRIVIGQNRLIDRLLIAMLTDGHVLLEGVPGLAKTLTLKTLAECINIDFKRVQFTPDMLPADITGTQIYNPKDLDFIVKKGPIDANLILADEINRAPAKVQSALLEAMQEKQVTIGNETFKLPSPFLVLATQNPVEQEGTYPLPEAQLDRFMLKVVIDYPTVSEERIILDMGGSNLPKKADNVVNISELLKTKEIVKDIYMDDNIKDYIVSIVYATRDPQKFGIDIKDYIKIGASPRATINLRDGAKAYAYLQGRGYVTPADIKAIAPDVLRHRIGLTFEAEAEELTSLDILNRILETVPVP